MIAICSDSWLFCFAVSMILINAHRLTRLFSRLLTNLGFNSLFLDLRSATRRIGFDAGKPDFRSGRNIRPGVARFSSSKGMDRLALR
jgi:hypothetical protein